MKNFSGLTITGATPDGYSVKANGYVKGSWLQSSVMQNYGSNTGKVCVFDNSGLKSDISSNRVLVGFNNCCS